MLGEVGGVGLVGYVGYRIIGFTLGLRVLIAFDVPSCSLAWLGKVD